MFQRITLEDWASIAPILSFILMFVVFVATTARALCMDRTRRDRLAALPLDDEAR